MYDWFVEIHQDASNQWNSVGGNAAHRGPAFLPWHRALLREFEKSLQATAGWPDPTLGLPYWDWGSDSILNDPTTAPVWSVVGPATPPGPVTQGPFAQTSWHTWPQKKALERTVGIIWKTLPSQQDVANLIQVSTYDRAPWNSTSAMPSMRNFLEGFVNPNGSLPVLHNRAHGYVGGDMLQVPIAPNDPIFFLHHANVDRIWGLWQDLSPSSNYLPQSGGPSGHNWGDYLWPWFPGSGLSTNYRPQDVWDFRGMLNYGYDTDQGAVADGSVIALECQGSGTTMVLWLDGHTGDGSLGLSPSLNPAFSGDRWAVEVLDATNNIVALKCLGSDFNPSYVYLNGETGSGTVDLKPNTGSSYSGTHWRVELLSQGVVAFR
jgi:tyrosinase